MNKLKALLKLFFESYLHLAEAKAFGAPKVSTDELAEALVAAAVDAIEGNPDTPYEAPAPNAEPEPAPKEASTTDAIATPRAKKKAKKKSHADLAAE